MLCMCCTHNLFPFRLYVHYTNFYAQNASKFNQKKSRFNYSENKICFLYKNYYYFYAFQPFKIQNMENYHSIFGNPHHFF